MEKSGIHAIPTMYDGVQFRSRLEARWAAFFDVLGWRAEYEERDYMGYIPDFIVRLPRGELLVEVKPDTSPEDLLSHVAKIRRSGYCGDFLIAAGTILPREAMGGLSLGMANDREYGEVGVFDHAILATCSGCDRRSFFHESGGWQCRVSGCHDVTPYVSAVSYSEGRRWWAEAGNRVQYKAPMTPAEAKR